MADLQQEHNRGEDLGGRVDQSCADRGEVHSLETVLSSFAHGTYGAGAAGDAKSFMAWKQDQEARENEALRGERTKDNDFSRRTKTEIVRTLLVLASLIAIAGLAAFFGGPTPDDKKTGIAASVAALSALGGLAAGVGLR
ncbi:MAG: hypothetical protein VKO39_11815 [Cyanobacteriota bacterium]|nr:hypothetical protein [Cyanobacteriota bacterium]